MTKSDLRDIFKYKHFAFSHDDSKLYFQLDAVYRNSKYLCNYNVDIENDNCIVKLSTDEYGNFSNITVITVDGKKLLINPDLPNLKYQEVVTLNEIEEESLPENLKPNIT